MYKSPLKNDDYGGNHINVILNIIYIAPKFRQNELHNWKVMENPQPILIKYYTF
jgi:hypothetical protein